MISRYSLPEMAALFSDEAKFALWLEVELLAVEGWAELGVIPLADAAVCRQRAPETGAAFVEAVLVREAVTDHDVAAFVDVVQEAIGQPEGSWIHHGLTSSDVVDTALCVTLVHAADLISAALDDLVATLKRRALEHANTPMAGRTHGMHAEPTTFGAKLALAGLQVDRDRRRMRRAREAVAVGKLSGAVGTYSNIDPAVEAYVCSALGLRAVPSTQVIARDRHAEYLYACTAIGTTIESIATEIRHLQRTEVAEVSEPFGGGQKGSSSMPHKRNPITPERLSGLARVLRGYLVAALEDVALWHERDISHSSVERIILPDASLTAYYVLRRMTRLLDGLVVHTDRMAENLLEGSYGLVFSQPVLLSLVRSGLSRDAAYRIVQRDAQQAMEERRGLRDVLEKDPDVQAALGGSIGDVLGEAFDLTRALAHSDRALRALEAVPVSRQPMKETRDSTESSRQSTEENRQ
jgi:adenylosuccinate lyase